jgi:hypothetical protein
MLIASKLTKGDILEATRPKKLTGPDRMPASERDETGCAITRRAILGPRESSHNYTGRYRLNARYEIKENPTELK